MDLYEAIHSRRDVREFLSDDLSDEVLTRILGVSTQRYRTFRTSGFDLQ